METIGVWISKLNNSLSRVHKATLLGALVCAIISHGYFMVNDFIYFDSTDITGIGQTFELGRWALALWGKTCGALLGNVQLPLFSSLLAIVFIAISATIIVSIFDIQSQTTAFFVGAIMVVFPVVTSTFGFLFTAPAYFAALLLATISAGIIAKEQTVFRMLIGAVVLAFATGIYQAYFPAAVTILLLLVMIDFLDGKAFASTIKEAVWFVGTIGLGLVFYFVLNKIMLLIFGASMSSYQGTDTMGQINFATFPSQIAAAYKEYFNGNWQGINEPRLLKILFFMTLFLLIALVAMKMVRNKISVINMVMVVVLLLLLPVATNLVYLMINPEASWVHGLMVYPCCFTFVLVAKLADGVIFDKKNLYSMIAFVASLVLWLTSVCYAFENNKAYLRMSIIQEQLTSFYTVLTTRIESLPGYRENMYVVFDGSPMDEAFTASTGLDDVSIYEFDFDKRVMTNSSSWRIYMRLHNGYEFTDVSSEERELIMSTPEFEEMENYPSDDSIRIIRDAVVVKF